MMLGSLRICREQIEKSDFRLDIKGRYVMCSRNETLREFIDRLEPTTIHVVGWKGANNTSWATIIQIGTNFLISRNPLPENILKGSVTIKGKLLDKSFGEIEDQLLCLETDYPDIWG